MSFLIVILTPLLILLLVPLLTWSLVQWLVVDLCICFRLFLEESSSFSGAVDYRLIILCFMSDIHL